MSAMDNGSVGRDRPNLQLSRRSLVAAGALMAALGPMGVKRAAAQNVPPNGPTYGAYCKLPNNIGTPPCLCFLSGTRILTLGGEVAIENLSIGDLVTTQSGASRAIRWIGRIAVDRDGGNPWRADAMPVRVSKDTFGKGSPSRDLYLSRSHMVHLDGVLIPVGDLINGKTIAAVNVPGDQIVYYHVELETHDVLIADGAPCESFLTTAEKLAAFDNADEYYALYGAPADMASCAPMAIFNGGRSEIASRMRSAVALLIDRRQPRDVVRDRLEGRALEMSKAA